MRNVEDLLHERGIEISHETLRYWWNRFGPMFAAEIRSKRVEAMRLHRHWRWHLDEGIVTKTRDRKEALKFLIKSMKRHGRSETIVTDLLRSSR